MADTISKIKVNELETATPKLTDTLLASGDVKEYACKIEDLKEVIGGGGGGGDWNANEGESGYIANRTHWVETGDSITGTFTLTQEDIENGSAYIENSDLAEDAVDTLGDITSINIDIIINNQTYKANIQAYIGGIRIQSSLDNSFNFDFYIEESQYVVDISFDSSIFVVGENTITIPIDTFHKINPNYIEDTLLWQRGHSIGAVQSLGCMASGYGSHAEGYSTTASGEGSHAEGSGAIASGNVSHAEGGSTTASGEHSHAEGYNTTANHLSQHVFGEWNIIDPSNATSSQRGNYVEIVGNGTRNAKSNARTLDWSGNEWLAGSISADGGLILKSPDGSSFTIRVANDGTLSATKNT